MAIYTLKSPWSIAAAIIFIFCNSQVIAQIPGQGPANNTLPLRPWNITRLNTGSPSGRPASFPYSAIYATITDPNYISLGPTNFVEAIFPPSTVECTIKWNTYFEEPYNIVVPCTGSQSNGKWNMEVLTSTNTSEDWNPPSPTRNFRLRFRLEESIVMNEGRVVTLVYAGEGTFSVGLNLDFVCGGSGVCSSGLKACPGGDGDRSVAIKQELVETRVRCINGTC
ncbi:hypothetical protein V8F06_008548 [Rhypophila decipiens]